MVMARAAETLTPVSLELGGKDPMIVLADADLERAANAAAWGGLQNTGQICISVERVYVEEPVYDEFVEQAAPRRSRSCARAPTAASYGSRRRRDDLPAQIEIVDDHVEDARRQGRPGRSPAASARGARATGIEPTVLADVDHSMKVMRDETFGPVVAGDEGARRRRGGAARQRHPLRALGLGVRRRRERGRADRPPDRGRRSATSTTCSSTTSRSDCRWAAGRTPGSASATAPRASAVLPHRGDDDPAHADRRSRSRSGSPTAPASAARAAPLHVPQRPRAQEPPRLQAPLTNDGGIDGLTRWLGLRWESAEPGRG